MLQISDLQFQVIAFLLEFIGLGLAFIEVRMPATAVRIAQFLGQLASPIQDLRNKNRTQERFSSSLTKLLNTILTLGTLPLIFLFAVKVVNSAVSNTLTLSWLVPELIVFIIQLLVVSLGLLLLSLVLYFTVAGGSDFATRFVEGRAVGTLGIMLATIGFMMELYQLFTFI